MMRVGMLRGLEWSEGCEVAMAVLGMYVGCESMEVDINPRPSL